MGRRFSRNEFIDDAREIVHVIDGRLSQQFEEGLESGQVAIPLVIARPLHELARGLMNAGARYSTTRDDVARDALDSLTVSAVMLKSYIDTALSNINKYAANLEFVAEPVLKPTGVITYQQEDAVHGLTCSLSDGIFLTKGPQNCIPLNLAETLFPEHESHTRVQVLGSAPVGLAIASGALWYENKLREK